MIINFTIKIERHIKMISVNRVISPGLQKSYVSRNGGNGLFHGFALSQSANGKGRSAIENSWLVAKGASAGGKNLSELWDSYLGIKGSLPDH